MQYCMLYKLASLSLAKPQKPEKFKESGASRPSVVRPQSNQSDHSQLCPLKQKHWDMRYQLHTRSNTHTAETTVLVKRPPGHQRSQPDRNG